MANDWTDQLAGARMRVDQRFEEDVQSSQFSNQEWGLIMSAIEFEIEAPQDPAAARMTVNDEHLSEIIPELDKIQEQMGGSPEPVTEGSGTGFTGRIRRMFQSLSFDFGGPDHQERIAAAKVLTEEYAEELQAYLEEQGRWEEICAAAANARERE